VALLVGGAGCGDDSTGPSPSEITGTWSATSILYADPSSDRSIDLVAGGGSGTLVLAGDGSFELTVTASGQSPAVSTGSWVLGGEVLTMTPAGFSFSWQFDCTFSADLLQLAGADAEWDLDGDLVPDAAKWSMGFVRAGRGDRAGS
jgi:hypothetical protein